MTSLILALLAQQANLQDVHIPAMPLEKAIQRVSETFHASMTVSTLLKDKLIFIEAAHVSEQEVRDQIAKVMDATWEMKDSGWHLGQSAEEQKMEQKLRTSLRLRMFQMCLDVRRESPSTGAPFTTGFAAASFRKLTESGRSFFGPSGNEYALPQQRLMSRFLAKFDPKKIAGVDSGERAVFALKPNAMQRPLDVDLRADIEQYRTESKIWNAAEKNIQANQSDGDSDKSELPENLGNILFTVYSAENAALEMELVFVPEDRKSRFYTIEASSMESFLAIMKDSDLESKKPEDFALTPTSSDFLKFLGGNPDQIPADRRAKSLNLFADPVTRDPMAYAFSEALVYDAKKIKRNVIVSMGDDGMMVDGPMLTDVYLADRFADFLKGVLSQEGNWIRFNTRPFEGPVFPRYDLKRIISHVRQERVFSLQDQAEAAALMPRKPRSGAISILEAFSTKNDDGQYDADALRTLGLLQAPEQSRALGPNGIPYGMLNAKLKQHLFECAYFNQSNQLHTRNGPGPIDVSTGIGQDERQFSSLDNEPTLMAPNGISDQAVFKIGQVSEESIRYTMKDEPDGLTMTPKGWGQLKFQLEHPADYENLERAGEKFTLDHPVYAVVYIKSTFRLIIGPNCEWTSQIQTTERSNQPSFTLNQMPRKYQAEFEAGYQTEANEYKQKQERKKNGGGGLRVRAKV